MNSSERRLCSLCATPFQIDYHERSLYEKLCLTTPTHNLTFPLPTLCPTHRLQRRWSFRNERNLYRVTCAVSGKQIISYLPPTTPYKVIDQSEWWKGDWDGTEFGRSYDFSKPFFTQFAELMRAVPHYNLQNVFSTGENCDYANHTGNIKDCYMIFDSADAQSCYYSELLGYCTTCIDCTNCYYCECLSCSLDSTKCYNSRYLNQCHGCSDSAFLYDCRGSHHCFFSVGLRNQSYVWRGEQLTREEYEKRWGQLTFASYSQVAELDRQFEQLRMSYPRRCAMLTQCESSTGNALTNCIRSYTSFDGMNMQDCHNVISIIDLRDSLDVEHAMSVELCREVLSAGQIYRTFFTVMPANCVEVAYCYTVSNVKRSFGCVSLKNQEYCILNKRYTEQEYYELLPRIAAHMKSTGEWGEFFPISLSPFGYNDTLAQLHIPLSEQEAVKQGYQWRTYQAPETKVSARAVSTLEDLRPNDLTPLRGAVFACQKSTRPFRLTAQGLKLYEQLDLPLPREHPEVRYHARLSKGNIRTLFTRNCARCATSMVTCYPDDFTGEVVCDGCYVKAMHG